MDAPFFNPTGDIVMLRRSMLLTKHVITVTYSKGTHGQTLVQLHETIEGILEDAVDKIREVGKAQQIVVTLQDD